MLKISKLLGSLLGTEVKTLEPHNKPSGDNEITMNPDITAIEGTPFCTAKKGNNRYVVIYGRNMITSKEFNSKKHAEEWAQKTDWFTILNVVGIYVDFINSQNNKN